MMDELAHSSLRDKVAVVTGGASGIGRATALRLLREGMAVVVGDINPTTSVELVSLAREQGVGQRLRLVLCDVSVEGDMTRLVRFACEQFGRLDCMVNNASVRGARGPLTGVSVDDWDRTQAIVLRSVFLGTKHAALVMRDQAGGGCIVNVSATAGLRGGWAAAAYSAAKAGVIGLTRCAAAELASTRIRCNAVVPGAVSTPRAFPERHGEDSNRVPLARPERPDSGVPEDIAAVVAFLASDDARFVVGQEIVADGGRVSCRSRGHVSDEGSSGGNATVEWTRAAGPGSFDWGTSQERGPEASAADLGLVLSGAGGGETARPPRHVLITGVSRGLGYALAERMVELGHTVSGCARSAEAIARLNAQWGRPHRFDAVDVADDHQVAQWSRQLQEESRVPDLLVNGAAVVGSEPTQLWRQSPENFEHVFQINVFGMVNVLRHFVPLMLRRLRGVIVNFSSGYGREAAPKTGPYCASKWAVEGLTRVLASELPVQRMAAVSLHPGIVHTETMEGAFGEFAERYSKPERWARIAAPYLLSLGPGDNGQALSVPGMTAFRGKRGG